MSRKPNPKNLELWRDRLTKASEYQGTQALYCRENGISLSSLNYWKLKLKNEAVPKSVSFLPVQVLAPTKAPIRPRRTLPDPKWVSEIIYELSWRFS